MSLSGPTPSIGPDVHELRLKDRSGLYRVIWREND
jgi:phage-related protein